MVTTVAVAPLTKANTRAKRMNILRMIVPHFRCGLYGRKSRAPRCRRTLFGDHHETLKFGESARAAPAKMPNPSIAKAVASYAGSMNIWEYLCVVRHASSPPRPQTHEIQRPKIWERFGSAARLKAGSHPIGGRDSVVTTGEAFEVRSDTSGRRSPLLV